MLPEKFYKQIAKIVDRDLSNRAEEDESSIAIEETYKLGAGIELYIIAVVTVSILWTPEDTDEFGWVKCTPQPYYTGIIDVDIERFILSSDDLEITVQDSEFSEHDLHEAIRRL